MLASEAEPRHYAGLALLKLADNFENHLRIAGMYHISFILFVFFSMGDFIYTYYIYYAEEGGIQALLRLGRVRSTDEQLQYKTSLTIGQLATNAVKLIPSRPTGTMPSEEMLNTEEIGTGTKILTKIRTQSDVQRGRELTLGYLSSSMKEKDEDVTGGKG
jgi:hypothetical protein